MSKDEKMEKYTVDARGLSCPEPVVLTTRAIREGQTSFTVLVNTVVSKENVVRCATKNGLQSDISAEGEDYIITISQ